MGLGGDLAAAHRILNFVRVDEKFLGPKDSLLGIGCCRGIMIPKMASINEENIIGWRQVDMKESQGYYFQRKFLLNRSVDYNTKSRTMKP